MVTNPAEGRMSESTLRSPASSTEIGATGPYDAVLILPMYVLASVCLVATSVIILAGRVDTGTHAAASLTAGGFSCIVMASLLAVRVRLKTLAANVARLEALLRRDEAGETP